MDFEVVECANLIGRFGGETIEPRSSCQRVVERLVAEHVGRVGAQGDRRDTARHAVQQETFGLSVYRYVGLAETF